MKEQECIPYAPALIESMRFMGYFFPSAIADLLDNSISAGAQNMPKSYILKFEDSLAFYAPKCIGLLRGKIAS